MYVYLFKDQKGTPLVLYLVDVTVGIQGYGPLKV